MQMRVTGRHLEVTAPLREHVEHRLAKLEHIFHNLLDAHVILFPERDDYVADITVTGSHLTLHMRERAADMYAAVDMACGKLERQVRRHKSRVRGRQKRELPHGERDLQAAELAEQEWHDEEWTEDAPADATGTVAAMPVLATQAPAGPMTLDEALASFDANNAPFLVFINPQSDDIDVLYRGPDGELGLITRS